MAEVFRALQHRLRDSTWTVVFKSLITVHLMIREGSPDITLAYLAKHRNVLAVSMFSDGQSMPRGTTSETRVTGARARETLTLGKQPRLKAATYDITPTTSPNGHEPTVTQKLIGCGAEKTGWRSYPWIRAC